MHGNNMILRKKILALVSLMLLASSMAIGYVPMMASAQTATTPAAVQANVNVNSSGDACGYSDWFSDPISCFIIPIVGWFGSWFLTIGGSILLLAGVVFDQLLQYLVIDFSGTIESLHILAGIQQAWQLFRDISNIGIIGIFVFVAIMTILGSAEYGAKRLIARVLIVAILLNFSLLFTRIVIESTNFVSGQFSRAMPAQAEGGGAATAQSFLKAFGIQDVWRDTTRIAQGAGQSSHSGWAAFLYGLVGGLALTAIAIVLLYGAFVITARALLLVFAMLTSALAFTSFLLPKMANQPYVGWSAWWSNLLKAAIFGPLLMVFLWITMTIIGQAANTAGAGAAIGAVADDPSRATPDAWASIILLIIGTGLLFLSIRAASSFASTISGFNFAGGVPLAFSSYLAGIVGRQTIGRGSLALNRLNDARMSEARVAEARAKDAVALGARGASAQLARATKDMDRLIKKGSIYDTLSKSSFSALNSNLGKQIAKGIGVSGIIGKKPESYGAYADRIAKEAAKNAEQHALTGKDKEKLTGKQEEHMAQQRDVAQKQLAVAEKSLEVIRATGTHQTHSDAKAEAEREIKKITEVARDEIKQMGRSGGSQTEIQKRIADRDSALKEQNHKIETAHAAITTMEKDALKKVNIHDIDEVKRLATLSNDALKKEAGKTVKQLASRSEEVARDAAARYAAGWTGSTNSTVAEMARDAVRKSKKDKEEGHHILEALKKQMGHGEDGHGGGAADH
jgi:hypothetical protein